MPKVYKLSEETRKKMSESQKKRVLEGRSNLVVGGRRKHNSHGVTRGENVWNWKAEKVGYCALHTWVRRTLGKAKKCSICGKEGTSRDIHWANKDHKYRRNLEDFIELCSKCHRQYDKENNNWRVKHR